MPETDKFPVVLRYKIYVLAVRIKGNNNSPDFSLPTSDIIERVFSSTGYALPIDLEMQTFFKVNHSFWNT